MLSPLKTRRRPRRALVGALSLALLGVSIARPLLDAWERSEASSIEAAHDPGRCLIGHDHAACQQLARSHAVPQAPLLSWGSVTETDHASLLRVAALRTVARDHASLPRAPPTA